MSGHRRFSTVALVGAWPCCSSASRSHTASGHGLVARRQSGSPEEVDREKWEYLVVPLDAVGGLKKAAADLRPEHLHEFGSLGWEAVGVSLKKGDLVAWPSSWSSGPSGSRPALVSTAPPITSDGELAFPAAAGRDIRFCCYRRPAVIGDPRSGVRWRFGRGAPARADARPHRSCTISGFAVWCEDWADVGSRLGGGVHTGVRPARVGGDGSDLGGRVGRRVSRRARSRTATRPAASCSSLPMLSPSAAEMCWSTSAAVEEVQVCGSPPPQGRATWASTSQRRHSTLWRDGPSRSG